MVRTRVLADVGAKTGHRAAFWGTAVVLPMLTGCGGGGASSGCTPSAGTGFVAYSTEWSGSIGDSQVIQLLTEAGTVLQTQVLNRGTTRIDFSAVPRGAYRFRGELRSSPNGGGTVLGRFETLSQICGGLEVRSRTSGSPTRVVVLPGSVSVLAGSAVPFFASRVNEAGEFFFSTDGSINWGVTGAGASISTSGVVSVPAAGRVEVQATDLGSGLSGRAVLTVNPVVVQRSQWTILIYLNAANDLHPFSTLNVNQLERVASNPQVRFVVQWKQSRAQFPSATFDGTRRLLVRPDSTDAIQSPTVQNLGGGVDMGQWATLRDFIQWGITAYPADRFGLVVWNHGNGWQRGASSTGRAVSYDDETGNAIQIWQLGQALAGERFAFLAWDASLMQMMEVAYEARSHADFIIGSEESPPGEGYPYDKVFRPFRDHPSRTTRALTESFVTATVTHPPYANRKITQSVVDTTKLEPLAEALDRWAAAMITDPVTLAQAIRAARDESQSYSPTFGRVYRDLWDVAAKVKASPLASPTIVARASEVQDRLIEAIVWEGNNANSPNSHGLSIDFSSSGTFTPIDIDYARLQLARDTRWDEWLRIAP